MKTPKRTNASKGHYYKDYDTFERFISYFNQIRLIKKTNPRKVLEVGIGNKTLITYLRNAGIKITGCDMDKSLKPDVVGDIRKLPFKDSSFDTVAAFQVLEHLPFEDFEKSIKELKRVSKRYVLISLPCSLYSYFSAFAGMNLPIIRKRKACFSIVLSPFFREFKGTNEHYWEMGYKKYTKRKIKKILLKHFRIREELQHPLNIYHYFFALEK